MVYYIEKWKKEKRSLSERSVILSENDPDDRISPLRDVDVVAGHSLISSPSCWETFRNNDWNLIIMVSGEGVARVGEHEFRMKKGSLYLFAPSGRRRFYSTRSWLSYWVHFPLRIPMEWPALEEEVVYALTPSASAFRRCVRELMEVLKLAMGCRRGWHLLALNLIQSVILRGNMLSSRSGPVDERLLKAEALLNQFERPMEMDRIAAACGMSRSVFYARFRETYGLSPRAWRERGQLNAIRILLESTSLPMAEICSRCGMRDMAQFFKRFKRLFGTTPSRYREQFLRDSKENSRDKNLPPSSDRR